MVHTICKTRQKSKQHKKKKYFYEKGLSVGNLLWKRLLRDILTWLMANKLALLYYKRNSLEKYFIIAWRLFFFSFSSFLVFGLTEHGIGWRVTSWKDQMFCLF